MQSLARRGKHLTLLAGSFKRLLARNEGIANEARGCDRCRSHHRTRRVRRNSDRKKRPPRDRALTYTVGAESSTNAACEVTRLCHGPPIVSRKGSTWRFDVGAEWRHRDLLPGLP